MSPLETWLKQATRCLATDSVARVRAEMEDHYHSARESALANGAIPKAAEQAALAVLGSAQLANRAYRRVLLTAGEARMLRSMVSESRFVCSHPILKVISISMPVLMLFVTAAAFYMDAIMVARICGAFGLMMIAEIIPRFLPIYSPLLGRVYRGLKWTSLAFALLILSGPGLSQWSWLLSSVLFYPVYLGFVTASIRRKLPVNQWPKALYL